MSGKMVSGKMVRGTKEQGAQANHRLTTGYAQAA